MNAKSVTNRFCLLVLIAAPLIVFGRTIGFDFVWDDDTVHLSGNPYMLRLAWENIASIWTNPYEGLYIPLSYTVWSVIGAIGRCLFPGHGDFSPALFHLVSVFAHVVNGILVFSLLRLLAFENRAALAGSLLFSLHPVQVESVAWVSEFRGLLATGLGLASLRLHCAGMLKAEKTGGGAVARIAAFALFILAMLSKPSAVVIPLMAALLDFHLLSGPRRKAALSLVPWLLCSVPIVVLTKTVQPDTAQAMATPFAARPLLWMDAVNFYLRKMMIPFPLAGSYARTPQAVMGHWWLYVQWVAPVGLAALLWRFRRSAPLTWLGFWIFIIGFLPVSGLVPFYFQQWSTVADRYLYMPLIGIGIAFAEGVSRIDGARAAAARFVLQAAVASLIVFWGGFSMAVQIPVWKDSFALWDHCVRITPVEGGAFNNRGSAWVARGRLDLAVADFDQALRINPLNSLAYNNRATALVSMGRYEEAIADFTLATEISPFSAKAYSNRGNVFSELKQYEKALADYDIALRLLPLSADTLFNRGDTLRILGRREAAIADFTRAIEINPRLSRPWAGLAGIHREMKQYEKAVMEYSQVIGLEPGKTSAYNNRAIANFFLGRFGQAWEDVRHAQAMGGTVNPEFLNELRFASPAPPPP